MSYNPELTQNQSDNTVLAGPPSGSAAQPTFRDLVEADVPFLSQIGSFAYFMGTISGTSTPVTITANNPGTVGNSVALTFDGSTTISAEIAAWNLANPTNQVTLTSGNGTQTPFAQIVHLSNGINSGSMFIGDFVTYANFTPTSPTIEGALQGISNALAGVSADSITSLTGDVTTVGSGAAAATIQAIQGNAVTGTTGTGKVVFSINPLFTGYTDYSSIAIPTTPGAGIERLYTTASNGNTVLAALGSSGNQLVVFQDSSIAVYNNYGSTITRGQAVIVNGTNAGNPSVTLAQANTLAGSLVYGLVLDPTIANGAVGAVISGGKLTNVDTSAFSAGDTLWLSTSTPGLLTNIAPVFPALSTKIGTVLVSSATVGVIIIAIVNAVISPVAALPVPFYFSPTASSDIAGYDQLVPFPPLGTETVFTGTGVAGTKTLIEAFSTEIGSPSVVTLPTGTWIPQIYASVDAVGADTSTLTVDVYKRSYPGGVETLLYTVVTPSLTTSTIQYDLATAQGPFTLLSSDRLVFKVSYTTTSAARVISFYTAGNTHSSVIISTLPNSIGVELQVNKNTPNGYAGLDGTGKLFLSEFPAIPNANLATMPADTLKGNNTGSPSTPFDLTVSQVNTMLGDLLIVNNLSDVASPSSAFANISPLTTKGDLIYETAAPFPARLPIGTTGQVLTVVGGLPVWSSPATSGTVTSVAFADSSTTPIYAVSGSPVTSTGTLTITLDTQAANSVFAGPATGPAAQPTFRALVASDIPSLSATYVTQSEVGAPSGVVPLDGSGKIPVVYLPSVVMQYQSRWNPNTNTPALSDGTGTNGYVYWVSAVDTGTVPGLTDPSMVNFQIGDLVIYSSAIGKYELTTPAAGVSSVNGSQGAVIVNAINQVTGDVTTAVASGSQSEVSTIAAIQGKTVAGTTGTGNVVFSASPTLTGTISAVAATFSGAISASNFTGSSSGTNTGDQTITLTGDIAGSGTGTFATTIQPNVVTNSKLAQAPAFTLKGNNTGSTANETDLTVSQVNTMLGDLLIANNLSDVASASTSFKNISPLTTAGDIIYESATPAPARLPIGTTGQVLTVVSGLPSWVTSNAITALTGDGTTTGPGSVTFTLATVNSNVGTFGSSTSIPTFTVNAKGLITAASGNAVIAPAGTLSGTVLNASVVTSSLTAVGTITTGVWNGTTIAIANGGTSAITAASAFNNLNPMTTTGDIIYESATNVASRLAIGTTGQVLTVSSGIPTWVTPPATGVTSVALLDGSTTPIYNITGSPVTSTGTLDFTLKTQVANSVFAGPTTGAASQPTFRSLVSADIPNNAANTTGTASNVTGVVALIHGGTGTAAGSADVAFNALSPITTLGDLIYGSTLGDNVRLGIGTAGQILTVSGGIPTWTAPSTSGTVTSVALTTPSWLTVTGSPITTAGTLAITGTSEAANEFLASPNGSAGAMTPRAIVAADIPTLNQNTTGTASNITGIVALINGGTGTAAGSANAAFNALSPMTTIGDTIYGASLGVATRLPGNPSSTKQFLTETGVGGIPTAPVWATISASDVPTLNQNTTGTASNVTGVVAIVNGGTGQTTKTSAFDALSPLTTSGDLLTYNGTDNIRLAVGSAGQVLTISGGIPTWAAPATSGTVTSVALTVPSFLSVSGSPITTAGTLAVTFSGTAIPIANGGTNAVTAASAFNNLNPMTTTGDLIYEASSNVAARLAIGTTGQILTVTGGIPTWAAPATNGTVTSVALTVPAFLTVSGSPITTSGTFAVSLSGTALPISSGGTSATTAASAFNNLNPMTTTGDLIYESATSVASRLAIGTTGQVLTVVGGIPTWSTSSAITALTGDGTTTGPGSVAFTLATVNSNVGTFGSSTSIPTFTVNAKGLITAASGNAVIAPAGTLSGATLASNVLASSLTSVGTITSGTWNGTTIAVANGGTGLATLTAHDVLIGNGTGAVTLVSPSTAGLVLTSNGTSADPSFTAAPTSGIRTINAQTGTTYTFVLTDGSNNSNNPLVTFSNASTQTVTVPPNSGVAFPVGTQIDVMQQGAGKVTFAAGAGVTINSQGGLLSIGAQYVGVSLIQTAANTWTLVGFTIA
jgi:hypothetical protein